MNIVYLKYAMTVAQAGSLTKAAEELYIAQPNLSRAIKEFEKELGITIFDRNSKGIKLTPDGELLVKAGKKILREIDDAEEEIRGRRARKTVFAVSGPYADYIAAAFAAFTEQLQTEARCEAFYVETAPRNVIANITDRGYKTGIVRYAAHRDRFFKDMLAEKGLRHEMLAEFNKVLLVGKKSPLAAPESVSVKDLAGFTEIAPYDLSVPGMLPDDVRKEELTENVSRRVFVSDRAVRLEIIAENPAAFMWTAPVTERTTARYGLVQVRCADGAMVCKDMLVYPEDYKLTRLDNAFIDALCTAKRKYLG